jgi:hypothetical protein
MSHQEQLEHFANELDALVQRFRHEYDVDYATVIACLQMKIHLLCVEAAERGEDEDS